MDIGLDSGGLAACDNRPAVEKKRFSGQLPPLLPVLNSAQPPAPMSVDSHVELDLSLPAGMHCAKKPF
jgi:hypothetical protein